MIGHDKNPRTCIKIVVLIDYFHAIKELDDRAYKGSKNFNERLHAYFLLPSSNMDEVIHTIIDVEFVANFFSALALVTAHEPPVFVRAVTGCF